MYRASGASAPHTLPCSPSSLLWGRHLKVKEEQNSLPPRIGVRRLGADCMSLVLGRNRMWQVDSPRVGLHPEPARAKEKLLRQAEQQEAAKAEAQGGSEGEALPWGRFRDRAGRLVVLRA